MSIVILYGRFSFNEPGQTCFTYTSMLPFIPEKFLVPLGIKKSRGQKDYKVKYEEPLRDFDFLRHPTFLPRF